MNVSACIQKLKRWHNAQHVPATLCVQEGLGQVMYRRFLLLCVVNGAALVMYLRFRLWCVVSKATLVMDLRFRLMLVSQRGVEGAGDVP